MQVSALTQRLELGDALLADAIAQLQSTQSAQVELASKHAALQESAAEQARLVGASARVATVAHSAIGELFAGLDAIRSRVPVATTTELDASISGLEDQARYARDCSSNFRDAPEIRCCVPLRRVRRLWA